MPIGTPAPDFSVPDQDGSRVTLSALRGKNVVLVFYPADDTSVCTNQLCEFRDHWAEAQARECRGVRRESRAQRGASEISRQIQVSVPLADRRRPEDREAVPGRRLARAQAHRYLIGPDGMIRYARRGKPSPEEVLAAAQ